MTDAVFQRVAELEARVIELEAELTNRGVTLVESLEACTRARVRLLEDYEAMKSRAEYAEGRLRDLLNQNIET